jgi:hypothetical protein
MALARTSRGSAEAAATTATTGSFTPSDNSLLVAFVYGRDLADVTELGVNGGSLTWTSRVEVEVNAYGLRIYTAPVTTGASMTAQVTTSGSATECGIHVVEYTGHDSSSPVGATATGSDADGQGAGTFTITLSGTPAATSEVVAGIMVDAPDSATEEGSGWTQLFDLTGLANSTSHSQARGNSTSTSVQWSNVQSGFEIGAVAVEIKEDPNPNITQVSYRFFDDGDELPHWDITAPDPSGWSYTSTPDNVAGTTTAASYPATVAAGDLIVWCIAKDDSPAITDNTGGLNVIQSVSNSYTVAAWAGWEIADGDEDGTTRTFGGDSEEFQSYSIRILAGTFDANNPIPGGTASAQGGNATDQTTATIPAITVPRANARVVGFAAVDADPFDATFCPAGWTDGADNDAGAVSGGIGTRDAATSAAETTSTAGFGINVQDAWAAVCFAINGALVHDGRAAVANINTGATLEVDTAYGCQVRVYNSGAATTEDTWQWQYNKNSAGWNNITGASSVVQALATGDFADGDDVTEYLGWSTNPNGSGTWISNNNAALETDGTLVLAAALGAGQAFETHLNFQIIGSDVADEDTIQLRIVYEDGTALNTYSNTPTITVNKAAAGGFIPFPRPRGARGGMMGQVGGMH